MWPMRIVRRFKPKLIERYGFPKEKFLRISIGYFALSFPYPYKTHKVFHMEEFLRKWSGWKLLWKIFFQWQLSEVSHYWAIDFSILKLHHVLFIYYKPHNAALAREWEMSSLHISYKELFNWYLAIINKARFRKRKRERGGGT